MEIQTILSHDQIMCLTHRHHSLEALAIRKVHCCQAKTRLHEAASESLLSEITMRALDYFTDTI